MAYFSSFRYAPASGICCGDVVLSKEISHAKWIGYGERTNRGEVLTQHGSVLEGQVTCGSRKPP
jgi:hypothetical protein